MHIHAYAFGIKKNKWKLIKHSKKIVQGFKFFFWGGGGGEIHQFFFGGWGCLPPGHTKG